MRVFQTIVVVTLASFALGNCIRTACAEDLQERHPRKEDTYTITSVMQITPLVNPSDMNDEFQDVRVLAQDKDSVTVEITYYPLYQPKIHESFSWHTKDPAMSQYLQPTPTENWDETMCRDLLVELRRAGIEPTKLSDKQLVEKVAAWAMNRSQLSMVAESGGWFLYFPNGKPAIYPPLRSAFEVSPAGKQTAQEIAEGGLLGRSMFYQKLHGTCGSSSVYLATIFKALGIPTRIILTIPPFDPNDESQYKLFCDSLHHPLVQKTVRAALHGTHGNWSNHFYKEVYVGHRWVRLNYSRLGQPILDKDIFGLNTHIYTAAAYSQMPIAETWFMRSTHYPEVHPKLSSRNPYCLISVQDHFGANFHMEKTLPPLDTLQTVTITSLYPSDSPELPKWVVDNPKKSPGIIYIVSKEWFAGADGQMDAFQQQAGKDFLLTAPQHPEVRLHLVGNVSDGKFQAQAAQVLPEDMSKLAAGVAYNIKSINITNLSHWVVAPNIKPLSLTASWLNDRGSGKTLSSSTVATGDSNSSEAGTYFDRAISKANQGDQAGALADCAKAIELNPKHALAYKLRGNLRNSQGDLEGSLADYNQAIELNPSNPILYFDRGNTKQIKHDQAGAIADYTKAIALNPQFADAYKNRGDSKRATGDTAGADADFAEAEKLKAR